MLFTDNSHVVNRHDIRVFEIGRDADLVLKTLWGFGREQAPRQQHLEGDKAAASARLSRLEDNAHPAASQFLQQFILAERTRKAETEGPGRILARRADR